MPDLRVMLAGKADLAKVKFPVALSPKLDGIRAVVIEGVVYSRNMKPIPNEYVQRLFGHLHGYDGELIVGPVNGKDVFRQTTSGVMSRDGEPDVKYCVFDRWDLTAVTWETRFASLQEDARVMKVPHTMVWDVHTIDEYEQVYLSQDYEGVMIRDPSGPYKNGRSSVREGWLLKVKRFEDSEAFVIGMEERMHNANEQTINALGYAERTSHQENLVGTGTMGALICRDCATGVEFNIGTGFTDEERAWWWNSADEHCLHGVMNNGGDVIMFGGLFRVVKYKFFPSGSKDKPRFPSYQGLREDI